MAMQEVRLAGDPPEIAALSCDTTVEALPDMSHHEPARMGVATGKIEVELTATSSGNWADARQLPSAETQSVPPWSGTEIRSAPGFAANAARTARTAGHHDGSTGSRSTPAPAGMD